MRRAVLRARQLGQLWRAAVGVQIVLTERGQLPGSHGRGVRSQARSEMRAEGRRTRSLNLVLSLVASCVQTR